MIGLGSEDGISSQPSRSDSELSPGAFGGNGAFPWSALLFRFGGKSVSIVGGDLGNGWVIVLFQDGTHREVPPKELRDFWNQPVGDAVLELAIGQANQCVGLPWICMEERAACAPRAIAGFFEEKEAYSYAAHFHRARQAVHQAMSQGEGGQERQPGALNEGKEGGFRLRMAVVSAAEFLRARSRWWQERQHGKPGLEVGGIR